MPQFSIIHEVQTRQEPILLQSMERSYLPPIFCCFVVGTILLSDSKDLHLFNSVIGIITYM